MKYVIKNSLPAVAVLVVILLCVWTTYENFTRSRDDIKIRIEGLFEECLRIDKDKRELENPFFYINTLLPCDEAATLVTIQSEDTTIYVERTDKMKNMNSEDKKYLFSQLYLLDKNPIRINSLDSLFYDILHRNRIPAKTAIIYKAKGETHYSIADSSFYDSAWKLEEVVIGFNKDIVLQVYAKLPFTYIVFKSLSVYIVVLLTLILCSIGFFYWKKSKRHFFGVLSKNPRTGILLREGLLYDKTNGVIVYDGTREITLTNYKLELFNLLLENNGQFVSSEILQTSVWPDGLSTKDALMQTVKRLRADLRGIPFLKVENLRGSGYRLVVEEEEARTDQNDSATISE